MKDPMSLPEDVQRLAAPMFVAIGLICRDMAKNAPNPDPDDPSLGDVSCDTAKDVVGILGPALAEIFDATKDEILDYANLSQRTFRMMESGEGGILGALLRGLSGADVNNPEDLEKLLDELLGGLLNESEDDES